MLLQAKTPARDATVSASGMRLVKLLVGQPPRGIAELTKAVGTSRTAVAARLNELLAAGFVERSLQRSSGRGRPHNVYTTTDAALVLLFADHQRLVIPAIWRAIYRLGNDQLTNNILDLVATELAEHYKPRVTAGEPAKRLQQMQEILCEEGGLVEIAEGEHGQLVLRKRTCPFLVMADERQSICLVDQKMMSLVVGRPVRRVANRHEGDPCCSFELVEND
jgi:DeoR family suf operon transcriptional repressor